MKLFKAETDTISSEEFHHKTPNLLKEFGWIMRNKNEHEMLTPQQKEKVSTRYYQAFKDDFIFNGEIPEISFFNLLGIKKRIVEDDDDAVISVVAPPGKGKSSFSMACARFIDPSFTVDRVIFSVQEFHDFLEYATGILRDIKDKRSKGQTPKNPLSGCCLVLDEGVYMIFSGDAQSKTGKQSQKLFSIIRALNLIVIVNITNFKKINKGVVDDRLLAMWKIKTKGTIQFLSKKKIERINLKKNELVFPNPSFSEKVGYIDKSCNFWREYEVKKAQFLESAILETNE